MKKSKEKPIETETKIAKNLLEISAVRLQPDLPFTWASGIKSPIYCDNRKTLSYPKVRDLIIEAFVSKAKDHLPFDLIAGVATGGIAHGALVADRMQMPFIYVRSSKKSHGTGQQVEGHFQKRQSCLVIEDLISTGKSSLEAVEALRESGLKVKIVLSIFSYQFKEAFEAFEKHGCEYESLSNYETLLALAVDEGLIKESDLENLHKWRSDPRNWKIPV